MGRILLHNASNPIYNLTPGLLNLDQRSVLMSKPGDTIVTRNPFDSDFLSYLQTIGYNFEDVKFLTSKEKVQTHDSIFRENWLQEELKKDSAVFLSTFHLTNLEKKYTSLIEKKLYGNVPLADKYGTKSGFRQLVKELDLRAAKGFQDLEKPEDVLGTLTEMHKSGINACVIKEDESLGGRGSTVLNLPDFFSKSEKQRLEKIKNIFITDSKWAGKLKYVVEEWIDGVVGSPSVQVEVTAQKEIRVFSFHDQVLEGRDKRYAGCVFPSQHIKMFREAIFNDAYKIADYLKKKGLIGFFGLDLVVTESSYYWVEANIRKTATLYPRNTAKRIFGEVLNPSYTEHVVTLANLKEKKFKDLQKTLKSILLNKEDGKKEGLVVDFIGTLKDYGRISLMAFGNTRKLRSEIIKESLNLLGTIK